MTAPARLTAFARDFGDAAVQALTRARARVSYEIVSAIDDSHTLYSLWLTHGDKTAIFFGSDLAVVLAAARARLDAFEAELPKLADMVKA